MPPTSPEQKPENRPSGAERFFNHGIRQIFVHMNQMIGASLVVAAGTYTIRSGDIRIVGVIDPRIAGYAMVGVGVILLVLNFLQGLYQLTRLKHRLVFQALLIIVYLFVSIRAAQLFVAFRTGS